MFKEFLEQKTNIKKQLIHEDATFNDLDLFVKRIYEFNFLVFNNLDFNCSIISQSENFCIDLIRFPDTWRFKKGIHYNCVLYTISNNVNPRTTITFKSNLNPNELIINTKNNELTISMIDTEMSSEEFIMELLMNDNYEDCIPIKTIVEAFEDYKYMRGILNV